MNFEYYIFSIEGVHLPARNHSLAGQGVAIRLLQETLTASNATLMILSTQVKRSFLLRFQTKGLFEALSSSQTRLEGANCLSIN